MSASNEDLEYWNHVYEDSQKSARFGKVMALGSTAFASVGLIELFESTNQDTQAAGLIALAGGGALAVAYAGIRRVNERRGDMALKNIVHIYFNQQY